MKFLINLLFVTNTFSYIINTELLPNPFISFGQQEIFKTNSPKWIEKFALKASNKKEYYKALHAWCYLFRINYPQSKKKIIWLLDKLRKPLLKYIFLAHYTDLKRLDFEQHSKKYIYLFLEYLVIREKMFRGIPIEESEIRANKYALSEYFYQKMEFKNQEYYLIHDHMDPFEIFDYHQIRTKILHSYGNKKDNTISNNDYFLAHLKTIDKLNYGLEEGDKNLILIDAEHVSLLIHTQNYTPHIKIVKKYPYLLLSLLTQPNFILTDDYWDIFLKLIKNSLWTPKIKFIINNNSHLKHTLGKNLRYLFPEMFSKINKDTKNYQTYVISGVQFFYSDYFPRPLLNNAVSAVKELNLRLFPMLNIRYLDINVPFIFDLIESELIVSTKSIFWSKELWQKVILRSKLYLQILNNSLIQDTFDDALPPLWLIDSVVNSKSRWSPSLHGLNFEQVQHLSLFPLSLDSLYNSTRNRSRKNLFYAYHWQCQKIGETLFDSFELSEIVNKIQQLKISQTNPPLLYQKLSIYFNASIEQLKTLIPQ